MKTNLSEVFAFRRSLYFKSMELIKKKGHDYNAAQQEGGDTLFNLRVCELLGIVSQMEQGILVRLSDKFMRLVSLTRPGVEAAVHEESLLDTIADIHNYVDYLGLEWTKRRAAGGPGAASPHIHVGSEGIPWPVLEKEAKCHIPAAFLLRSPDDISPTSALGSPKEVARREDLQFE